jgi:hypothetical protein
MMGFSSVPSGASFVPVAKQSETARRKAKIKNNVFFMDCTSKFY